MPIEQSFTVQGMLWNSTLSVSTYAEASNNSIGSQLMRDRGSALTSGHASFRMAVKGKPRPNWTYDPFPNQGCLSCPFERANEYFGRPPYDLFPGLSDFERILVKPSGWEVVNPGKVDPFRQLLSQFIATPGNLYRAASDLVYDSSQRFGSLGGAVRGVGIDVTGRVTAVVKAPGLSSALTFSEVTAANRAGLFAATTARSVPPRSAVSTHLTALKSYAPLASLDSKQTFSSVRSLVVPSQVLVESGNAANQLVTLTFSNSTIIQPNLPSRSVAAPPPATSRSGRDGRDAHGRGGDKGRRHGKGGNGHGHDCDRGHGHQNSHGNGHNCGHGHDCDCNDHDDDDCDDPDDTGTVVCRYRGGSRLAHPTDAAELERAAQYVFESCDNGAAPGDVVTGDSVTLHVNDGDTNQPNTAVVVDVREQTPPTDGAACEQVALKAFAPFGGNPIIGRAEIGEPRRFGLPASLARPLAGGCNGQVKLSFRAEPTASWTHCVYQSSTESYTLSSCSAGGTQAGRRIDVRELELRYEALSNCTSSDAVEVSLAEPAPCGDLGPDQPLDPEGTVLSALRGELYVVGNDYSCGTQDAYVYGLGSGRWQHIVLDGAIANVLAATFVSGENKLYFIDKPFGFGVRLGRWDTVSAHVEWLGTLSDGCSYERVFLTQSLDGRLIFAASANTYAGESPVWLLRYEDARLHVEEATVTGKIFGPPLADAEGVSLDLANGDTYDDIRQTRISNDDFEPILLSH